MFWRYDKFHFFFCRYYYYYIGRKGDVILRHTTRSHRTGGKKRGIGTRHFDFAHVVM